MAIDFKMKPPIPGWEAMFEAGKTPVIEKFKAFKNVEPTDAGTLEDVLAEMDTQGITHSVILAEITNQGVRMMNWLNFSVSPEGDQFYGFIGIEDMTKGKPLKRYISMLRQGSFMVWRQTRQRSSRMC